MKEYPNSPSLNTIFVYSSLKYLYIAEHIKEDSLYLFDIKYGKDYMYVEDVKKYPHLLKPLYQCDDGDVTIGDVAWKASRHKSEFILNKVVINRDFIRDQRSNILDGTFKFLYPIFKFREHAEEWVKKHNEEKNIEWYDEKYRDQLAQSANFINAETLLQTRPRLYYAGLLQLIANELNKQWKPNWNSDNQLKWVIIKVEGTYKTTYYTVYNLGVPVFLSVRLAEKAIELMGDKLDFIYER